LNAKLDHETDADKKDMLTRMKSKMEASLNNAKSLIDSHGDGKHQDAARMVILLFYFWTVNVITTTALLLGVPSR